MSYVILDGSIDTSDPQKSELPNCMKQELDVMTDNENKILEESLLNEFRTEGNDRVIDQIQDEDCKFWTEETCLSDWTSDSVKTEMNENVDAGYDSKEFIFSNLEAEKKLNEIKIENRNHQSLNNETECTEIKIKEVNEMDCFIQAEREAKQCGVLDFSRLDLRPSRLMSRKCNFCDYISHSKAYLQTHIQAIHMNQRNLKCHLCGFSSAFKPNLQRHIDWVHLKLKKPQKSDLQSHIKSSHLKMKNEKCPFCDKSWSLKAACERHINSVHLKLRNHKCHFCNFSFSAKGPLQSHIRSIHLKLRNHKCELCDYTSSDKSRLNSHINSVHLKLKKNKCHVCDYSSSRKFDLQTHINSVHLKLKSNKCYKCEVCDYSSSTSSNLKKHIHSRHIKVKIEKFD